MTLRGLRGIEPKLGRYDFDAGCVRLIDSFNAPVRHLGDWRLARIRSCVPSQKTFSLGIFCYVERGDGGIKRGKAVRRIRGRFGTGDHAPERAFEEAERVCEELEQKGV